MRAPFSIPDAGPPPSRTTDLTRLAVGLIWLGGAAFNLLVTWRMADPFGWLAEGSWLAPWRWFFGEVVGAHPAPWTALLIAGEIGLGVLTLGRGTRARLGLAAGALFSVFLFSLGTSYTLMMGPYALLLGWLARHEYRRSLTDTLSGGRFPRPIASHRPRQFSQPGHRPPPRR